jgi:hypothetical protein
VTFPSEFSLVLTHSTSSDKSLRPAHQPAEASRPRFPRPTAAPRPAAQPRPPQPRRPGRHARPATVPSVRRVTRAGPARRRSQQPLGGGGRARHRHMFPSSPAAPAAMQVVSVAGAVASPSPPTAPPSAAGAAGTIQRIQRGRAQRQRTYALLLAREQARGHGGSVSPRRRPRLELRPTSRGGATHSTQQRRTPPKPASRTGAAAAWVPLTDVKLPAGTRSPPPHTRQPWGSGDGGGGMLAAAAVGTPGVTHRHRRRAASPQRLTEMSRENLEKHAKRDALRSAREEEVEASRLHKRESVRAGPGRCESPVTTLPLASLPLRVALARGAGSHGSQWC